MTTSIRLPLLLSWLLAGAACAPRAMDLPPGHPARADAPAGRLAGPPPALIGAGATSGAPAADGDHAGHGDHAADGDHAGDAAASDAPAAPAHPHDHP